MQPKLTFADFVVHTGFFFIVYWICSTSLFQALPATLTTVEKVEVLPSPREMDPRLLVWKGGSVLGKLESSKELWIKPLEWALQGRRVLRDKALFVWSKD